MPKFVIHESRYIDGVYHKASPEYPKVVEIPEAFLHKDPARNPGLKPYEGGGEPAGEKLGRHFADGPKEHVQSSAQAQSEPTKDAKSKRAADTKPI